MKKRLRLKNKKHFFLYKLLIILGIFLSFIILILYLLNKKYMPLLINYAEIEMEKIVNVVINNATDNEAINKLNSDELLKITKNGNGDIQFISFDSVIVNQFLDAITKAVQDDLLRISSGNMQEEDGYTSNKQGIVFEVSLGMLTSNVILSKIGPKIPVKLEPVGFINSNIETNIKEYGINNALLEVYVYVDTKTKIVLPFASKDIIVTNKIPIAVKIIQGNVPEYYNNGLSSNSNLFSLPIK